MAEKHMAGSHLLGPFFCPASLSEEEDESSDASSSDVVALSSSSSLSDAPAQKREACSQQNNLRLLKLIGAAHSRIPIRYLKEAHRAKLASSAVSWQRAELHDDLG